MLVDFVRAIIIFHQKNHSFPNSYHSFLPFVGWIIYIFLIAIITTILSHDFIEKALNQLKHIEMKTYQQKGNTSLLILNHRTSKKILLKDVILLEGNINYTIFHLEDGRTKVVPHSIKFFEPYLETHGFLRVHRAYMVNPIHVKGYQREDDCLMMTNGLMANISRRRKRENNIESLFN